MLRDFPLIVFSMIMLNIFKIIKIQRAWRRYYYKNIKRIGPVFKGVMIRNVTGIRPKMLTKDIICPSFKPGYKISLDILKC